MLRRLCSAHNLLRKRAIASAALLVASVACQDRDVPVAPGATSDLREVLAPRAVGVAGASDATRPSDESPQQIFSHISAAIPSFAGFYFDSLGRPTAAVSNAADSVAAKVAVLNQWSGMPGLSPENLRVAIVTHSFRALERWRDAARRARISSDVVTIGIGERENRLLIGVKNPANVAGLRTTLAALIGAPESAMQVTYDDARSLTTLQDSVRPTLAGLLYGAGYTVDYCTLGLNVKLPSDATNDYLVTASHCTQKKFMPDASGQYLYQPWKSPANYSSQSPLAYEVVDPRDVSDLPNFTCYTPAPQPYCRYADAALFRYSTSGIVTFGEIARTTYSSSASAGTVGSIILTTPNFRIVGEYPRSWLVAGTGVHKMGGISGWTWGQITSSDLPRQEDSTMVQDYIPTNLYSLQGDSGGPVFVWFTGTGYGSYDAYVAGFVTAGSAATGMGFSTIRGAHADLGAFTVTNTSITPPMGPGPGRNY